MDGLPVARDWTAVLPCKPQTGSPAVVARRAIGRSPHDARGLHCLASGCAPDPLAFDAGLDASETAASERFWSGLGRCATMLR